MRTVTRHASWVALVFSVVGAVLLGAVLLGAVLLPGCGESDAPKDADPTACSCEQATPASDGEETLACYCQDYPCASFDDAMACRPTGTWQVRIEEHAACHLVVIAYDTNFYRLYSRVYDMTTHELVGAFTGNDSPSVPCGAAFANRVRAGIFPDDATCPVTKREDSHCAVL